MKGTATLEHPSPFEAPLYDERGLTVEGVALAVLGLLTVTTGFALVGGWAALMAIFAVFAFTSALLIKYGV